MIKELVPVVFLVFAGKAADPVSAPKEERPATPKEVRLITEDPTWEPCIWPKCRN